MFKATENLERCFCRVCGSHVFTSDRRWPDVYGFPAGVFENEPIEEPVAHYFVADKAAWFSLPADAKCFGDPNGTEGHPA